MPLRNQLRVDKILSGVSVRYQNEGFIAEQAFPVLSVSKDSDKYRVYSQNYRIPETARAPGGLANEFQFQSSFNSYLLEYHGLKDIVPDRDADNYDEADLMVDTTEELTEALMRRKESDFNALLTTANWSLNQSLAAGAIWSLDTILSNPILHVDSGTASIVLNSGGKKPNYMILPFNSLHDVKNHQSVLDRVKYTSQDVDLGTLKGLFGLPEILVPSATNDTSNEGAASVLAHIIVDKAFIGYKPPRASAKAPSAGYMFRKQQPSVKRYRDEPREGTWIEVNDSYQFKVVASLCGYLINNIK